MMAMMLNGGDTREDGCLNIDFEHGILLMSTKGPVSEQVSGRNQPVGKDKKDIIQR